MYNGIEKKTKTPFQFSTLEDTNHLFFWKIFLPKLSAPKTNSKTNL